MSFSFPFQIYSEKLNSRFIWNSDIRNIDDIGFWELVQGSHEPGKPGKPGKVAISQETQKNSGKVLKIHANSGKTHGIFLFCIRKKSDIILVLL